VHDWLPDLTKRSASIRETLAKAIEASIRSGVFRPGETLPAQRLIADLLAIHVNTVNGAIAEVARQGLVEGKTRRGTVVLSAVMASTQSRQVFRGAASDMLMLATSNVLSHDGSANLS
jgi:GntR family transcriptional regulator